MLETSIQVHPLTSVELMASLNCMGGSVVGGEGGAVSKTQIDFEKALQLSTDAVQKGCDLGCKSTSSLLDLRKKRAPTLDLQVGCCRAPTSLLPSTHCPAAEHPLLVCWLFTPFVCCLSSLHEILLNSASNSFDSACRNFVFQALRKMWEVSMSFVHEVSEKGCTVDTPTGCTVGTPTGCTVGTPNANSIFCARWKRLRQRRCSPSAGQCSTCSRHFWIISIPTRKVLSRRRWTRRSGRRRMCQRCDRK
jgi:hypothetical protein